MSLLYVNEQYTIYFGFFALVAGVIGNGMNILIFSTIRTYRKNPCAFYFLITSIDNIVYITINLISRMVITGYGINLTRTSLTWCKSRGYLVMALGLISFACSCLPPIDQFLVTSKSAYLRSLSNIKSAYLIVFIVTIVCCLNAIPNLIYQDISLITQTCVNTNAVYAIYLLIYALSFRCIIPIIIMVIFGYLTYRNIRQTRVLAKQHADRQLIKMTLFQIILLIITITPSGINSIYSWITSTIRKDPDRLLRELFVTTVVNLLTYIYYIGNFYIFLMASSRFRRAIKDRILFWRKPHQVVPV